MYGAMEFYHAARDAGLTPIIGCEAYLAPRGRLAVRQFGLRRAQIPWQAPSRVQLVGVILVAAFLITVPSFAGYRISGWTLALTITWPSLSPLRSSRRVSALCFAGAAVQRTLYSP